MACVVLCALFLFVVLLRVQCVVCEAHSLRIQQRAAFVFSAGQQLRADLERGAESCAFRRAASSAKPRTVRASGVVGGCSTHGLQYFLINHNDTNLQGCATSRGIRLLAAATHVGTASAFERRERPSPLFQSRTGPRRVGACRDERHGRQARLRDVAPRRRGTSSYLRWHPTPRASQGEALKSKQVKMGLVQMGLNEDLSDEAKKMVNAEPHV